MTRHFLSLLKCRRYQGDTRAILLFSLLVIGNFPESTLCSGSTNTMINKLFFGGVRPSLAGEMDQLHNSSSNPQQVDNDNESIGPQILALFSDLDGTLIHYPSPPGSIDTTFFESVEQSSIPPEVSGNKLLHLPASSTGLRGVISSRTLVLCRDIRSHGTKLVLISGMRTSTMLDRLPYLPKADAYCCEAGGRIFYPTVPPSTTAAEYRIEPVHFDGAMPSDLMPFGLVEDMDWRAQMERSEAAGPDGYKGHEVNDALSATVESNNMIVPSTSRSGRLWEYARYLKSQGFIIDAKGYSTCFRVNRKHQNEAMGRNFDNLLLDHIALPLEIASSTNLGCVDFYPSFSGKKNCCQYLAGKLTKSGNGERTLANRCVCLCDDDNDIEMALACLHAYIPAVSSESMNRMIHKYNSKMTSTFDTNVQGSVATEAALQLVLERTNERKEK